MSRRWACGAAAAMLLCLVVPPALAEPTGVPEVVELGGAPVEPSTDRARPFELDAGIWSDTLGAAEGPDSTHYFSYRRTMADSTVHVGVTGANAVVNDGVSVVVTTPEGDDCGSDDSTSGYSNPFGTFGAGATAGPDEPDARDSACLRADEVRIAVGRGSSSVTNPLPVAIRIVEEAPPTATAGLPTPPPTPRVDAPAGAGSGETVGATSFEDAPYLEPGAYDTTVAEGEERLWRVRLDWGQQLATRLEVPRQDAATQRIFETLSDPEIVLVQVDPLLDSFPDAVEGSVTDATYTADEEAVLLDGSPPVGYLNRFDGVPATVPGDYWVTVSVAAPEGGREPLDVPMRLSLDVTDAGAADSRPTFPDVVAGPGGSAGPDGYDPSTPYLIGKGQFSADISGTPLVPDSDESDGVETRTLAGLALAAVSAALCLAGVASLRRRSRQ